MTEGKHTPGIAHLEKGFFTPEGQVRLISIGDASVAGVSSWLNDGPDAIAEARANAERLVLCWNMHDELVAALTEIAEAAPFLERAEDLTWVCEVARKALARATQAVPVTTGHGAEGAGS